MSKLEPELKTIKLQKLAIVYGHVPPIDYYFELLAELTRRALQEYKYLYGDAFLYIHGAELWLSVFIMFREKNWFEKIFGL
ncbi:MAG: hypothetical protein QXP52_00180 [Candidatus Aenigmatarchaeota archaeon]